MFTHEKFNAYTLAIESARIALDAIEMLPAGHSSLRDQLRRAAFSIPLNIAEGTGKTGRSDRKRYYDIARGSAMECAAIWDVIILIDPTAKQRATLAKAKLMSVVRILSTVCGNKFRKPVQVQEEEEEEDTVEE